MFDHQEPAIFFWILHLTGEDHPPKKIQDPAFDTMVVGMFGLKILPLKMIEKERTKIQLRGKSCKTSSVFCGRCRAESGTQLDFFCLKWHLKEGDQNYCSQEYGGKDFFPGLLMKHIPFRKPT